MDKKRYKLVFNEPGQEDVRVYFIDELYQDDNFIIFLDPISNQRITYNKNFLVKLIDFSTEVKK